MRALLPALVVLALASPVWAGVDVGDGFPRQGEATTVTVTRADGSAGSGAEVFAVYRPGSEVAHEERVGTADARGRLAWTPTDAGLVSLRAEIPTEGGDPEVVSTNLSARYSGVPLGGLVILVVAGFILYGGVIRGFRTLGQAPPPMPPDT